MNDFEKKCLLKIYEIFNSLDIYAGISEISEISKNTIFEFNALINLKHFFIKIEYRNKILKVIDIEFINKQISKSPILNKNYQDFFNLNDFKKTVNLIKEDTEIKKLNNLNLSKLLTNIFLKQLENKHIQNIPNVKTILSLDIMPDELLKKISDICSNPEYAIFDERVKTIIKNFLSLFIYKKHTNDFIENFFNYISNKFANKYTGMQEKERFELLVVKLSAIVKQDIINKYKQEFERRNKNEIKKKEKRK